MLLGALFATRYADVFLSVANLRSIAKAAAHLGVSQSAVSQKIALLESKLAVKLFDRSTRPLTLTPEGRKLKESLELYNAQNSETTTLFHPWWKWF